MKKLPATFPMISNMDIFHILFGFAKICRPKSKAFEKLVFLHHQTFLDHQLDLPIPTKSAPTSYRWAYNPYK